MAGSKVVSRREWLEARRALLAEEKALVKAKERVDAQRRSLPWVRVEESYTFASPEGPVTLPELFGERSQLLVYHFMFGRDWDEGCPSCSFWADSFEGSEAHLRARDTSFVAISRAPVARLEAYRERMGWSFRWVSSGETTFNRDFGVAFDGDEESGYNYSEASFHGTEAPGASAFVRDAEGAVFHSYSTFARGLDPLNAAYAWLDLTAQGRDEADLPYTQAWVRRHDQYA